MEEKRRKELEEFCQGLGMTMQDLGLLNTALTHTSYAYEAKVKPRPEHNQRLEFLGDSVLSLVVSTHLYRHYPQLMKGSFPNSGPFWSVRKLWHSWLRKCSWVSTCCWAKGN